MGRTGQLPDTDFERQNEMAVRQAREADHVEPRAEQVTYDATRALVLVELRSGYVFGFPPGRVAGLEGATEEDVAAVRISPSGDGLQWGGLDVHVSWTGLVVAALNLRDWAPRIMGQSRSAAKARAVRVNGMKGGRPARPPDGAFGAR